jgi:hypothetical protein
MKIIIALTLCFLAILINAEQKRFDNYSLIRFQLKGAEQIRTFNKYFPEDGLDIWYEGIVQNQKEEKDFDVLFSPAQQQLFFKLSINKTLPIFHNVQILNKNIQVDLDNEIKSLKEDSIKQESVLKTLRTKEEKEKFLDDEFFNK